ncbi:MAG: TIGR00725 family protein [Solirubrobacterales bacterium]
MAGPARRRQVAVIGSSEAGDRLAGAAEEVGRGLAGANAVVVCGGRGGVMEAAARGARLGGGDVIGILPGEDPEAGNPDLTHVVATGIGRARNLAVVASADAVIAIGGEWGTLTEIGFARGLGRRVIVLEGWEVSGSGEMRGGPGIEQAPDAARAVELALRAAADTGGSGGAE